MLYVLQVAEPAGAHDPAPDDYGVPVSVAARHRAEPFGRFTGGPYAAAAALVHTLARYRWRPSQTRASPCLPHGTAAPQ